MPQATLNLPTIELESTLRPTGLNGAPTSADYNATAREMLSDLANIAGTLNSEVLPLLNALSANASNAAGVLGVAGSTIFTDTTDQTTLFFDAINASPLTVSQTVRVLDGKIQGMNLSLEALSVQVKTLSTSLTTTGQTDTNAAVSGLYGLISGLQAQVLSLTTGAGAQAQKNLQSQTVGTTLIQPGAKESVTVLWAYPFNDNNYSVSYALNDASGALQILGYTYLLNGGGIEVLVWNKDMSTAFSGVVNVTSVQVGSSATATKNMQGQIVPTTTIAALSVESLQVLWDIPFVDNNYTVAYALNDNTGFLQILGYDYLANGFGVIIHVSNLDTHNSHGGVVSVIARQVG